jgi:hypothetical protein
MVGREAGGISHLLPLDIYMTPQERPTTFVTPLPFYIKYSTSV